MHQPSPTSDQHTRWWHPETPIHIRHIIVFSELPGGLRVLRITAHLLLLLAELLRWLCQPARWAIRRLVRAAEAVLDPYDSARFDHPSEDPERQALLGRAWKVVHR
jgi:hypothetical protein